MVRAKKKAAQTETGKDATEQDAKSKKADNRQGQPPTAEKQPAQPIDRDDQESMAEAYQEIVDLSAHVDELEAMYQKKKGASLAAKKNYDTADKELREMIRRYGKGDTQPSLFNEGKPAE